MLSLFSCIQKVIEKSKSHVITYNLKWCLISQITLVLSDDNRFRKVRNNAHSLIWIISFITLFLTLIGENSFKMDFQIRRVHWKNKKLRINKPENISFCIAVRRYCKTSKKSQQLWQQWNPFSWLCKLNFQNLWYEYKKRPKSYTKSKQSRHNHRYTFFWNQCKPLSVNFLDWMTDWIIKIHYGL